MTLLERRPKGQAIETCSSIEEKPPLWTKLIFYSAIVGFPLMVFYFEISGSETSQTNAKRTLAAVCHCFLEGKVTRDESVENHLELVFSNASACRKVMKVSGTRISQHYAQHSSSMRRDLIMLEVLDQALEEGVHSEIIRTLDQLVAYSQYHTWLSTRKW